jgi:hypothetical protein
MQLEISLPHERISHHDNYKIITTCFSPPLQDPCDETLANTIKQSTQQSQKKNEKRTKERGPKFKFKPRMMKPQSGSLKVLGFTLGVRDSKSVEFLNTILVI